ncbi:MAG: hypothetical protein WKG07_34230, partial [Hymenobacter sp.]
ADFQQSGTGGASPALAPGAPLVPGTLTLDQLEAQAIRQSVAHHQGNLSRVARGPGPQPRGPVPAPRQIRHSLVMSLRVKLLLFVVVIHAVLLALAAQLRTTNAVLFIATELLLLGSLVLSAQLYWGFVRPLQLIAAGTAAMQARGFHPEIRARGPARNGPAHRRL